MNSFQHDNEYRSNFLRPTAAAEFLGVAVSTLAKWRVTGEGPRFGKLGPRVVAYSIADLESFVEKRMKNSTTDKGGVDD